jgi:hypothetical protein
MGSVIPGTTDIGTDAEQADLDLLNDDSATTRKDKSSSPAKEEDESEEDSSDEEPSVDSEEVDEEEEDGLEDEEEEEESEEEEEEEVKPHKGKLKIKEINKKYPELFKEYPELRNSFFRDKEFARRFNSPADADEVISEATAFRNLGAMINNGEVEKLIGAIEETGPKQVEQFSENFLPALNKKNPDLYIKTVMPVIDSFLKNMYLAAVKTEDSNKMNAAKHAALWIFNDVRFATGELSFQDIKKQEEAKKVGPDPEREKLEQEKRQFFELRYVECRHGVESGIQSRIRRQIVGHLPDGISDFLKDTLVEKIAADVDGTVARDQKHMNIMRSLWNRAKDAGFTEEWKTRLVNAYLARALPILPGVRSRLIVEGTKGIIDSEKLPRTQTAKKKPAVKVSGSHSQTGKVDSSKIDYSKTSDMDILNGKINLK